MASSTESMQDETCNIEKPRLMACGCFKPPRQNKKNPPADVPPGHLAVNVGEARRRFVIRADYLNHPLFSQLLDHAYDEYGRSNDGPLVIPCKDDFLQEIVHSIGESGKKRRFSFCKMH